MTWRMEIDMKFNLNVIFVGQSFDGRAMAQRYEALKPTFANMEGGYASPGRRALSKAKGNFMLNHIASVL